MHFPLPETKATPVNADTLLVGDQTRPKRIFKTTIEDLKAYIEANAEMSDKFQSIVNNVYSVTTNVTSPVMNSVYINTSGGGRTITLPASNASNHGKMIGCLTTGGSYWIKATTGTDKLNGGYPNSYWNTYLYTMGGAAYPYGIIFISDMNAPGWWSICY